MAISPVSISRKSQSASPMSEVEWKTRVDLAACYRLIALNKMDDMHATHISARIPGSDEHYLINPYGLLYSQVTASNLVKIDLEGNIIQDTPYSINPAGFVIHSAVHGARPQVACVLHTHTVAGIAVSCLEEGLLPLSQKSMRFFNRIAYHDYEGKADDLDERSRLVRDLGEKNALILRNHGLLTCGGTIERALKLMMALEKSCQIQLAAMATGRNLIHLSDQVMEHAARQFDRDEDPAKNRYEGWPSLLAMLDKVDPDYKT